MLRRTFIQAVGATGAAVLAPPVLAQLLQRAADGKLQEDFTNPPRSADLWVIWHWNNRLATKTGITADLEAMARSGISTVTMFSIGAQGAAAQSQVGADQDSLSPKWWGLMEHAVAECARLGLVMGMDICDGWGSAGGPWITPELSMQKVVWAETPVRGGERFSGAVARGPWIPSPRVRVEELPAGTRDYYRDIAVLAYPVPSGWGETNRSRNARVTTSFPIKDVAPLLFRETRAPVIDTVQPGYIQFSFDAPFTLRSVRVDSSRPLPPGVVPGAGGGLGGTNGFNREAHSMKVEASDDGVSWRRVGALDPMKGGWQTPISVLHHALPETSAQHFRLSYSPGPILPYDDNDRLGTQGADNNRLRLSNVELSSTAVVHHVEGKNASMWGLSRRMEAVDAPAHASVPLDAIVDLTRFLRADGTLDWQAPAGEWRILRIGHVSTGTVNSPAGAARGLECDKLNAEAARLQYSGWFGAARQHMGSKLADQVLKFLFIDSWECGSQNWSTAFPAEFRKRRGYDLTRYLPAMCGIPVGDGDVSERFLLDVRSTIAEMIRDNFYKPVYALAKASGVTVGGETHCPVLMADDMLQHSEVDIPTGEFWPEVETNWKACDIADATSAAQVYDKPVVMTESFTGGAWSAHPGTLKALGDHIYAQGVNRFMLHVWQQQYDERLPGPPGAGTAMNRHNTWWEPGQAWRDYLRRCQLLLQAGRPVADIAYFTGENLPRRAVVRPKFGSVYVADPEPPESYAFDSVNRDALLRLARAERGRMSFPGGASYKILILPKEAVLSPEVARKIRALVQDGLVLCGPKPRHSPSLSGGAKADEEVRAIADQLWGAGDGTRVARNVGSGRVYSGMPLAEVLIESGVQPDLEVRDLVDVATGRAPPPPSTPTAIRTAIGADRQGGGVQWIHRRLPEGDLYFISSQEPLEVSFDLSLRGAGRTAEVWNPVTAVVEEAAQWHVRDGRTHLPMRLPAHGSVFVLLRSRATEADQVVDVQGGEGLTVRRRGGRLEALAGQSGAWTVVTASGKRIPAQIDVPPAIALNSGWNVAFSGGTRMSLQRLQSWTELADPAMREFSGTATYTNTLDVPAALANVGARLVLELGKIGELARVRVNGKELGVVWTAPFEIDITSAVRPGANALEIEVTNTWTNKLVADLPRPAEQRTVFVGGTNPRQPFIALPSGLIGPVRLRAEGIAVLG